MAPFLSDRWIEELADAARACPELTGVSAGVELVVQHHVTAAPDAVGGVAYHVVIGDGAVRIRSGVAPSADVTFTQDYATAVGVASGTTSALQAFHDGRVEVRGDVARVRAAHAVLGVLDAALAEVRRRTTYGGSEPCPRSPS